MADADIECREGGRWPSSTPSERVTSDLTMTGVHAVPAFLDSPEYAALVAARG